MPLELVVDKIESVPEAARGAYVAKDGKFHLDFTPEDTSGLKSALTKTRTERDEAAKQAKAWAALGKTPDEIAAMVTAADAAKLEKDKAAGNFDAILKQHQDKWAAEKTTLETELNASRSSERGAILDTSIMGALTKEKAIPEGIELLTERLGKRIKFEIVDGKRKIQIMQADGKTPMAGAGADGAATFDDLVKEAKKTYPSLFEGTGAGGGGKQPGNKDAGGSGDKTIARAEWDKLNPYEQREKVKAGIKPVD